MHFSDSFLFFFFSHIDQVEISGVIGEALWLGQMVGRIEQIFATSAESGSSQKSEAGKDC